MGMKFFSAGVADLKLGEPTKFQLEVEQVSIYLLFEDYEMLNIEKWENLSKKVEHDDGQLSRL